MQPQSDIPTSSPLERRSTGTPFSVRNLLPGLAIGVLLGIAGVLTYLNHFQGITKALYTVTIISFGVIVLSFLIVFVFRQFITQKILGENSVGDFLNDAQAVSDTVTDQLASKVLVNVAPETSERVRKVLPRLANWFIWGRLRNWWWNWFLGIFVSLGGITGTMLLMNQNELLKNQNALIQHQMSLEEANRRSALIVLMSNIMDKVDNEIEEQKRSNPEDTVFRLSPSIVGQIVALSHSFKPYRYLEGDSLISKPLSPERGQLLITITRLPLDTSIFRQIYSSSNFTFSDLPFADFEGMFLKGMDLSNSNLQGANLSHTNIAESILTAANLQDAFIYYANLEGAILYEANLRHTLWRGGIFRNANFSKADLRDAEIRDADLEGLNFEETILNRSNLYYLNFKGATLRGADLSEAAVSEVDFSNANLRKANLYNSHFDFVDLSNAKFKVRQFDNIGSLTDCIIPDSLRTYLMKANSNVLKSGEEMRKQKLNDELNKLIKESSEEND